MYALPFRIPPYIGATFVARRGSAVGISTRIPLPFRRQQWRSRVAHGTAPAQHLTPTEHISSRASPWRNHVTRRYSSGGADEGKERRQSPQGDQPEELKSSSTFSVASITTPAEGSHLSTSSLSPPQLPLPLPFLPPSLPPLWRCPSPAIPLAATPFLPYRAILFLISLRCSPFLRPLSPFLPPILPLSSIRSPPFPQGTLATTISLPSAPTFCASSLLPPISLPFILPSVFLSIHYHYPQRT